MAQRYEKSPRQRMEWFGGATDFVLATSSTNGGYADQARILSCPPRLRSSQADFSKLAFPAGIVRGESCSIARFIAHACLYDRDRRQQNVSFAVGLGLIKQEVEDDAVADPQDTGQLIDASDPLIDLRASWVWHHQTAWNPQSAGANYTVFEVHADVDTTNSRVFESNDVLQYAVQVQTLANSGTEPVSLNLRCTLQWRCLLRLD